MAENVSLIQLRKHYFPILDVGNTGLIIVSLCQRTQLKLYYIRGKTGGGVGKGDREISFKRELIYTMKKNASSLT